MSEEEPKRKITKGEAQKMFQNAGATGPCQHKITFVHGERIKSYIKYTTICFTCRAVIDVK